MANRANRKIEFDLGTMLQDQYTKWLPPKMGDYHSKITSVERKMKQIA